MANIAITRRCNRSCGYCFAMDNLEKSDGGAMSLADFDETLDWLQRSGIGEARLLGGEPTIHPDFEQFVDRTLARGMHLMVFSGGLIPARALRKLRSLSAAQVNVLINVIAPTEETGAGTLTASQRKQRAVFAVLGRRVALGLNIDSPRVNPHFLLDLIEEHDLSRSVRLGLAHPILHGDNDYLHARHYRTVGASVADFALRAQADGVAVDFDCGWVPCMFPDGVLEALGKTAQDVGLRCSPILDVLPDRRVLSCFALSNHHVLEAAAADTASRLRNRFSDLHRHDRACMLFKSCTRCEWRRLGTCTGGCLSASLRRRRHHTFAIEVPSPEASPRGRSLLPAGLLAAPFVTDVDRDDRA